MGAVIQIGQLLLSLSILVILHELGHFLFAKLFNTRVEKFYLFFDPWFSLFKYKKGDTEYGIGWLPLGGYVKISGMIDESLDREQLKKPPQPYEFRSKPAWQRLMIMLGGVTVNLILGIVIYSFVLFLWGEKYLPNKNITDGIWCADSLAYDIGLQNGDKIISINEVQPEEFSDILGEIIYGGDITLERKGQIQTIEIPTDFIGKFVEERRGFIVYPRVPFIVGEVPDTSQNAGSGLQAKDQVVGVEGIPIKYYDEYFSIVDTMKGRQITLDILRNDKPLSLQVKLDERGKLNIVNIIASFSELERLGIYKFETEHFNFFQAIPAGLVKAWGKLGSYIRQFKLIFDFKTGAYKGIGGFGTIGGLFPPSWDWHAFWEITAFLSLILAFMNVLPIPALDGGHVLFLLFEMVTGRKPGDKFLEYAQIVGLVLLIFLLAYANGNDLVRWIQGLIG
ncbi:MAG: RIP metalloprotease RseP [Bacteroidales bacterium]|nr:RIP metalloprotease RseP [Bacteroidales bacterium]